MPLLYIDCSRSGLSGDMMVSALHDLGVPEQKFQAIATAIKQHLEGTDKFSILFEEVSCNGMYVTFLKTELGEQKHHRSVTSLGKALNTICTELKLTSKTHQLATSIFSYIVEAESKIHKIQPNAVHLHELASADTIFDAISVAMGLDALGILEPVGKIFVSDVAVGGGTVKIAHGTVPVPAPATAEIMQQTEMVIRGGPIDKELLTPTGAAILAALKPIPTKFLRRMKVIKVGRGAGTLAKEGASTPVTVYLGEDPTYQEGTEEVVVLETNLDDVSGEYMGHALQQILEAGALDAYISPIQMKKSRPANILHVLCKPEDVSNFLEIIFAETGTLGVRILEHYRMCIPREIRTVKIEVNGTNYEVRVKVALGHWKNLGFKPEYEDLAKISKDAKVSVPQLAKLVIAEYLKEFPPYGEK